MHRPELSSRRLRMNPPRRNVFVGIDSDGCVFDSMAVKQTRFFFPAIIATWGLEPIADAVREVAAFVNLKSYWRGRNRFEALVKVFELLGDHPAVHTAGVDLPDTTTWRRFLDSGGPVDNGSLKVFASVCPSPELDRLLAWSAGVNVAIARSLGVLPVFPGVEAGLRRMADCADTAVISQTPCEALQREWRQHGIDRYVGFIAGQEAGSKTEQLRAAAGNGRYASGQVLMIGDAPGDLQAARDAHALFYPIVPGAEAASWHRFNTTAFDRFLAGTYSGDYESGLIRGFEASLPVDPPWRRVS